MRSLHFITQTAIAFTVVVALAVGAVSPLALLNSDVTLTGVVSNLASVSVFSALLGFGLAGSFLIRRRSATVSVRHIFLNSLVLAIAILVWYYGAMALLFNWPINLEKTTPDYFENRGLPLLLGGVSAVSAFILWVGWALWSARRNQSPNAAL
jgi:hypothetical protein